MQRRHLRPALIGLLILVLCAFLPTAFAIASFVGNPLRYAVEQVRQRGAYSYDARISTTTIPQANVANAGSAATSQTVALRGEADLHNERLALEILTGDGGFGSQNGVLELRIADGQAQARTNSGAWESFELPNGVFSPSSDFLGLLGATRDVSEPVASELGGVALTRYTFTLDTLAFAEQMRAELEQSMRQAGQLPVGASLSTIDAYLDASGSGELFVDAEGLPRRLNLELRIPDAANGTTEGTITVDFSGFAALPSLAFLPQWAIFADWPSLGLALLSLGLVAAFAFTLILVRHSRRAYAVTAIATIIITVSMPLLQANSLVLAAESTTPSQASTPVALHSSPVPVVSAAIVRELAAGSDSDNDGLSDSAELAIGTDPALADSDDDGLSDGAEVLEIGTSPTQQDTDGDGLGDGLELEPITGPDGRTWYLDPFNVDSNNDGLNDLLECLGDDFCPDSDGDDLPDAWDEDNDNDGVPDSLDSAPRAVLSGGTDGDGNLQGVPDGRLELSASNVNPGNPLLFEFTLRPTNPSRLWYSNSILDWPSDDREGQIRRVFDTTLGSSGNLADGDGRMTPMLELSIPYVANSFGGLPVKASYSGSDLPALDGVDLDDSDAVSAWFDLWLDRELLNGYQISVRLGGADRSLIAYLPLDLLRDPVSDTPVAFTATMFFRPSTANLPTTTARLAWSLQTLVDSCTSTPAADDPAGESYNSSWYAAQTNETGYTAWAELSDSERNNRWCEGSANWETQLNSSAITYYDDFYAAALNVQEERGIEYAVAAQNPTAGNSAFQPHLWNLARGLDRAFVGGRDCDTLTAGNCQSDEQLDLTPATIAARWDRDQNAGISDEQRWNIPADALSVRHYSFSDEGASSKLFFASESSDPPLLLDFLNDTFVVDNVASNSLPTVLVARLQNTANSSLSQGTTLSAGSISFDMAEASSSSRAALSWQPFSYKGAGIWESADYADSLEQLALALEPELHAYGGSVGSNDSSVAGATELLKNFYLALVSGHSGMVTVDGVLGNLNSRPDADLELAAPTNAAQVAGQIVEGMTDALLEAQKHRALLFEADQQLALEALGNQRLTGDGGLALSLFVDPSGLGTDRSQALYSSAMIGASVAINYPQIEPSIVLSQIAGWSDQTISIGSTIESLSGLLELGDLIDATQVLKDTAGLLNDAREQLNTAKTLSQAKDVIDQLNTTVTNLSKTVDKATETLDDTTRSGMVIGLVVEGLVFGAKLMALIAAHQFDTLAVIGLVAETAVSVLINVYVMGLLAAIVPIGTIIAAIMGVIDAVVSAICFFTDAESWWCDGISGNLVKAVTVLVWSNTPTVDMEAEDRVTPTDWQMQPIDPVSGESSGMMAGNLVNISSAVLTRLRLDSFAAFLRPSELSGGEIDQSTFVYEFTTEQEEDEQQIGERYELELGSQSAQWVPDTDSDMLLTQTITTSLQLPAAAINWHPEGFYLAEGYAVPGLLCVLRICTIRTETGSNYINLAPSFAFDVLPNSLDAFFTLTDSDGDGGFRLAWDSRFPDLKDADGDGLRSRAVGGADPNDNSPDSDSDGLPDLYELENAALGLDPNKADSDGDGLSDLEELRYGFDPAVADMDNDGLLDGEEMAGWAIVYGYDADDNPLRFVVRSDPRKPDTDGDGLLDKREQVYGTNPRVVNSSEPLQIQSRLIENDDLQDGIVSAGSMIDFSAQITSTLRDRFALGLFESDLENTALSPDLPATAYRLGPLASTTMTGTLDLSTQLTTEKSSVLTRAGAIIADLEQLSGGRVLWLPFEEADSSAGFADAAPFANAATCSAGSCPSVVTGYAGRAVAFSSGQELTVAHSEVLSAETFTLSFWLKPQSSAQEQILLQKANADASQISYRLSIPASSNSLRFFAHNASCAASAIDLTATGLTLDRWSLVSAVYDGSQVRLYINGKLSASGASSGLCATTDALKIGGLANSSIDEVAFYPSPMTDAEVRAQFRDPVLQLSFNGNSDDSSQLSQSTNLRGAGGINYANSRDGDQVAVFDKKRWIDVYGNDGLDMQQGTGQFTLSAFVRPVPLAPDTSWQGVLGWEDGGNGYPSLSVNASGQLRATFGNGSTLCDSGATNSLLTAGTWSHVAVSYTGTQFVFFVDGVQHQSLPLPSTCTANNLPVGSSFSIGRTNANATFNVQQIVVDDEGDGSGNAEYEGFWNGSSKWYQEDIDAGDVLTPSELRNLPLNGDQDHRFELIEDDDSYDDVLIDMNLKNFQVNAAGSWSYDGDGEGSVAWSLWNDWFNGDLDEVRIYRVALEASDVSALYSSLNNRSFALETRLEEPPTTTLFRDGSGNFLSGYCSGTSCPTSGLNGRDGQAARFDGDDAISIADRPALDLSAGLSIALWAKLDAPLADQELISKDTTQNGGYSLGIENGELRGAVRDQLGNLVTVSGGSVPTGVWTHLALSVSPGQFLVAYINGDEVARTPLPQTERTNVAVGRPINRTATIYGDANYQAEDDTMLEDVSGNVDFSYGNDDEASSLRTNGSCLLLFDDDEYEGASWLVCDDTASLHDFDDRTESAQFFASPPSYNSGQGALQLQRSSLQSVQIEPSAVGDPSFSTISLAAWVKPLSLGQAHTIAARSDDGMPEGFLFRIQSDGKLNFQAGNGSWTSLGSIAANSWTHVAVTLDGTRVRFYINGVESGSSSFGGNINDHGGSILIGRMARCGSYGSCDFFDGFIKQVAIFTRALDAEEVSRLQETPSGAAPYGRVVFLPFDENYGTNDDGATIFRTLEATNLGANDSALMIGRSATSASLFARGELDEIALLEYAASEAEIEELMNTAPVLRMALDESLGATSAADSTTTTSASCVACPLFGARGRIREAAVFGAEGNTAALSVPDAARLDLDRFSIELWVRPDAVRVGEQVLLSKATGANNNYTLSFEPGTLLLRLSTSGGSTTAQRALNQGQWNHVLASYDGTQLQLFINGTAEPATAASDPSTNDADLLLGAHSEQGVGFAGMLDELSIYNYALSSEAVTAHYQYQESWFDVVQRHDLVIDGDAPSVALSLEEGSVIGPQPLTVSVAASDPSSAVAKVWYDADGDAAADDWQLATYDSNNDSWAFTFTPIAGSAQVIRAYAEDRFGHQSAVASVNAIVDREAPSLTLAATLDSVVHPLEGSGSDARAWLLPLSGTVNDAHSAAVTIAATIVGDEGELGALSWQATNGAWSGQYRFSFPPNGRYTLKLSATDALGNRTELAPKVLQLDATAPVADVTLGGTTIGKTASDPILPPVLSGTLSDIPSLPSILLQAHFEEAAGATRFLDSSLFQSVGSCAGTACPTALSTGRNGAALSFDGNDSLLFALPEHSGLSPFTLSLWAKPQGSGAQTLLALSDAEGSCLELQLNGNQLTVLAKLTAADAIPDGASLNALAETDGAEGLTQVGALSLSPDEWNHIAISFDAQSITTYHNGGAAERYALSASLPNVEQLWLGSRQTGAPFYQGALDEVTLYGTALADSQIALLAGAVQNPVASTTPSLLHLRDADNPAAAISLTATLTPSADLATWSAPVPDELEGFYLLNMQTSDALGNARELENIWNGEIDTQAPRVSYFRRVLSDGSVQVRCTVTDFNLDPSLIDCPVPEDRWQFTSYNESWYTGEQRLYTLETPLITLASAPEQIEVCDSFGNCSTTIGATLGTELAGLTTIDVPSNNQVISTTVAVNGYAMANAGLDTLAVTVGSDTILAKNYSSEQEDLWSTTFTPLADGVYPITAQALDANGAIFAAQTITITADVTAPALSLPEAEQAGAPQQNEAQLDFTVAVTEAMSLASLEARVDGGVWMPLGTTSLVGATGLVTASLDLQSLGSFDGDLVLLEVRAIDGVGHQTLISRELVLDNTAPRVTISTIVRSRLNYSFTFTGSVNEGSGIPTMTLIVEKAGSELARYTPTLTAQGMNAWDWNVTTDYLLEHGDYQIWLEATDSFGNLTRIPAYGVSVQYEILLPLLTR